MSRAAQLARDEADRVEAEDDETTDEPDAERPDEPDAEPAEPVDQARKIQALERENDRRAKALERIMGEDFAALTECPTCVGFVPGYIVQGQEVIPDPAFDDASEACPKCLGYGRLRTRSLADGHDSVLCQRCSGAGWVTKAAADAVVPVASGPPPLPYVVDQAGNATPSHPDAWGRPGGHPHYGVHPAHVGL